MIQRKLFASIIYLSTLSAFGQYLEHIECEQVGTPDWSIYEQYLKDKGAIQGVIRELDQNITAVSTHTTSYRYVQNKLYVRWSLDDTAIPYVIRFSDIMDEEIKRVKAEECAFSIYPDSILLKHNKEHLLVTVERENREGFDQGIAFFLSPLESEDRLEVQSQLENCDGLLCKMDVLLKRKLYLDALSLVEMQFAIEPEKEEELKTLYWKIVNWSYMDK